MRQVSSPVRWGAGRKGRQDLARSLPGFKVLGVLFLGAVSSAFLPSKQACGAHQFRYLGVGQQYPGVTCTASSLSREGSTREDGQKMFAEQRPITPLVPHDQQDERRRLGRVDELIPTH
jgi:hypothetical protein